MMDGLSSRVPISVSVPSILWGLAMLVHGDKAPLYSLPHLKFRGGSEYRIPLAGNANSQMAPLPGQDQILVADSGVQLPRLFYGRLRYGENGGDVMNDYDVVYVGQASRAKCYSGLNAFRLPGIAFEDRLKLRYYSGGDHDWSGDLEQVYFEDSLVLAATDSLYYHPTGQRSPMASALPVVFASGCQEFGSHPSGAKVLLNGQLLGTTPVYLSGLSGSMGNFYLTSNGYLTTPWEHPILPRKYGAFTDTLVRIPVPSAKRPDLKALLKTLGKSHQGFAEIRKTYAVYLGTLEHERDSTLAYARAHLPKFSGENLQDKDEAARQSTRYDEDTLKALRTQSRPFEFLLEPFDTAAHPGRTPLDSLESAQLRFECRTLPAILPISGVSFDPFNGGGNYRFAHARYREQGFFFAIHGKVGMSLAQSDELDANRSAATVLMEYWNIPVLDRETNQFKYCGLRNFRIKADQELTIDSKMGFEIDTNEFTSADIAFVRKRIAACKDVDILDPCPDCPPPPCKWCWWAAGIGSAGAIAAGAIYYYRPFETKKKDVVYPVPVGEDK